MKKYPLPNYIFLILILCLACTGCKKEHAESELIHRQIMGKDFYIPHAYVDMPYTSIGNKSALLQAYYPGDMPVPGDANDLWKKGEWYKNVRTLMSYVPKPSIERSYQGIVVDLRHATKVVKTEYGLIHQTQPENQVQDFDDFWIESETGKIKSYISCGEASVQNAPQYSHHFYIDHFYFQISYDKRLLPEWKTIHEHVVAMFKSFESPESAKAYFENLPSIREENSQ